MNKIGKDKILINEMVCCDVFEERVSNVILLVVLKLSLNKKLSGNMC